MAAPTRILAIGAHPDDAEIYWAGALARFVAAGAEVHLATVCRGDRGGAVPPLELAAMRKFEATEAAKILGGHAHFLDLDDGGVDESEPVRDLFLSLLRRTRPELVITHSPTDYHDDHVKVAKVTWKTSWQAATAAYATAEPVLPKPPALFYADNLASIGFEPTHLVDISSQWPIKERMFGCHASQIARSATGRHRLHGTAEAMARLRGEQAGVAYAEGFRPALDFGRRAIEPVFV